MYSDSDLTTQPKNKEKKKEFDYCKGNLKQN
jgi:hypothetical protein